MAEPRRSEQGCTCPPARSGRHLHRYGMRWKGTDRMVDVVLAADVADLEAENARLREEKSEARDLLRRAAMLFPLPALDPCSDFPERIRQDVARYLRRG